MWKEIFKFELKYRINRPETYLFFGFLFAFSIFAVDFIFQGVELGKVKLNAPIVIGKAMGATTGIFMILASMIMGMPMIRDDKYQITPLIYTQPIKKEDLLFGRFLGSFLILILIFCGVPLGMMLGEFLPWHIDSEMMPFRVASYLSSFVILALPTLFFGAALFFVTGTLSRNLLVVYTQGIILFVVFLLTKAITNDYLQGVLDPFSLTTTTQISKDWTVLQKNNQLLPFQDVLMVNKLFWMGLGVILMWFGYYRFRFTTHQNSKKNAKSKNNFTPSNSTYEKDLPIMKPQFGLRSQYSQLVHLSCFYLKSLLKETSFWAIVICAVLIIIINSISLGTVYEADSYPTTYFIVEELQELSIYFFLIILLFYSGELYWKEHSVGLDLLSDATPSSKLIILSSKILALIGVYKILIISLILSGLIFQFTKGYYHFDIEIYLSGFFLEIFPFLVIYTLAAFIIQALINNKFVGILVTLIFMITILALGAMGYDHILFYFGGGGLLKYSEMNGYGYFMKPYLWTKAYWLLFGSLGLIMASSIAQRGMETKLSQRLKKVKSNFTTKTQRASGSLLLLFVGIGAYNYYQTYFLNEVWSEEKQHLYRADYEKQLKQFEYKSQPSIVEANLSIELFPEKRSYELLGEYTLKNEDSISVNEIHIQKIIESDVNLTNVRFSEQTTIDSQYQSLEYIIYHLSSPLASGDSIKMYFHQNLKPKGFNTSGSVSSVLGNGTFIRNNEFPTIGYNKKYELKDQEVRKEFGLGKKMTKAEMNDINELILAKSGSDSRGIKTKITIGTEANQTAITSGNLINKWKENNRNYFEYQTDGKIINFYSILSGRYKLYTDTWTSKTDTDHDVVDLEIYHHPRHTYNLERMMHGMKASLDYYTSNFTPYQYEQLRIIEFPRYEQFAQSFPNSIPFSESIGFMLDINDSTDVDMTFFVTAHEIAHQWWGMQVETANVKGRNFVLETLSQYSALMIFKQQFPQDKVDQFLTMQQDLYEVGQQKANVQEVPLLIVENEKYIYYNKGVIVMNELQELIGEDNVNKALRLFIKDWNSQNGLLKKQTNRYATSEDLIGYILEVSPMEKREKVNMFFREVFIGD